MDVLPEEGHSRIYKEHGCELIHKSRFSFSSEQARELGDSMIEHYLNLTKSVPEGVKLD